METIGERIKRLRMEQGLSQRQLAVPGVTFAYISRVESGQRTPSVKALRLIAPKLGVTADYLETGYNLTGEMADLLKCLEEAGFQFNDDDNEKRFQKALRKIRENERKKTGVI